jgi:hypothetical protein
MIDHHPSLIKNLRKLSSYFSSFGYYLGLYSSLITFPFVSCFRGYFVHLPCIVNHRITLASAFIAASFLYTVPTLISITFSYSQYLFYNEDYFQTMTDEHNTRDTTTYFKLFQNSAIFRFHTILNFF